MRISLPMELFQRCRWTKRIRVIQLPMLKPLSAFSIDSMLTTRHLFVCLQSNVDRRPSEYHPAFRIHRDWPKGAFSMSNPTSFAYSPGQHSRTVTGHRSRRSQRNKTKLRQSWLERWAEIVFMPAATLSSGIQLSITWAFRTTIKKIPLTDPDIFSDGGIPKFPQLESYCR